MNRVPVIPDQLRAPRTGWSGRPPRRTAQETADVAAELQGLGFLGRRNRQLQLVTAAAVVAARSAGCSWREIDLALGTTTAHTRYAARAT